jgi:hypothetical protein
MQGVAAYDTKTLDCGYKALAFDYAKKIQPWLDAVSQQAVFDSLQLESCGHRFEAAPAAAPQDRISIPRDAVFVTSNHAVQSGDGTAERPLASVHAALRQTRRTGQRTIVLDSGIHFLNETIALDHADNNLTITSKPDDDAWLSGGVLLPASRVKWVRATELPGSVWKADVSSFLLPGYGIDGLFTATAAGAHRRMTRARYPNGDVEESFGHHGATLQGALATTWQMPPPGPLPSFTYHDLSVAGNPSGVIKDDSTMGPYNAYASGKGGVCDSVWDTSRGSYWCSNASAGGWANVDQAAAKAGRLNIPVGMTYDASLAARFGAWKDPTGAVIHVAHTQGCATCAVEL